MKIAITNNRFNDGDFFDVRHNDVVVFSSSLYECRMYCMTFDDDHTIMTRDEIKMLAHDESREFADAIERADDVIMIID